MPEQFNPFKQWLGLDFAGEEPNFYELLGISQTEVDPAAIESACTQQLEKLKTLNTDEDDDSLLQTVTEKIENALTVLIDSKKRAKYDRKLRSQLRQSQATSSFNSEELYPPRVSRKTSQVVEEPATQLPSKADPSMLPPKRKKKSDKTSGQKEPTKFITPTNDNHFDLSPPSKITAIETLADEKHVIEEQVVADAVDQMPPQKSDLPKSTTTTTPAAVPNTTPSAAIPIAKPIAPVVAQVVETPSAVPSAKLASSAATTPVDTSPAATPTVALAKPVQKSAPAPAENKLDLGQQSSVAAESRSRRKSNWPLLMFGMLASLLAIGGAIFFLNQLPAENPVAQSDHGDSPADTGTDKTPADQSADSGKDKLANSPSPAIDSVNKDEVEPDPKRSDLPQAVGGNVTGEPKVREAFTPKQAIEGIVLAPDDELVDEGVQLELEELDVEVEELDLTTEVEPAVKMSEGETEAPTEFLDDVVPKLAAQNWMESHLKDEANQSVRFALKNTMYDVKNLWRQHRFAEVENVINDMPAFQHRAQVISSLQEVNGSLIGFWEHFQKSAIAQAGSPIDFSDGRRVGFTEANESGVVFKIAGSIRPYENRFIPPGLMMKIAEDAAIPDVANFQLQKAAYFISQLSIRPDFAEDIDEALLSIRPNGYDGASHRLVTELSNSVFSDLDEFAEKVDGKFDKEIGKSILEHFEIARVRGLKPRDAKEQMRLVFHAASDPEALGIFDSEMSFAESRLQMLHVARELGVQSGNTAELLDVCFEIGALSDLNLLELTFESLDAAAKSAGRNAETSKLYCEDVLRLSKLPAMPDKAKAKLLSHAIKLAEERSLKTFGIVLTNKLNGLKQ